VWEKAIQVHGGIGYTWEAGLHFYCTHIVALRTLCEAVVGRPGEG
jgi:alkylation response protein AidB-like acyl-CoA dehydrogenase